MPPQKIKANFGLIRSTMNTKKILLPFFALSFLCCTTQVQAQNGVPGWDPLPDSLFLIWGLEQDQVRRLRVIEEDHDSARADIQADQGLSAEERDRQLRDLAMERRKEIRAVLQVKQFEDWERRSEK